MWSYDPTYLNTTTPEGRLYTVRLLTGDTDCSSPLSQDEEISFALTQNGDSVYTAAVWICRAIAAKFSRLVDTQLDGALEVRYSDRSKQYNQLAFQLEAQGKKLSGRALGIGGGGVTVSAVALAEADSNRIKSAFRVNQFDNPEAGTTYIPDEPNGA
jgi:lipoate-protein ligase A